ncbi:hypothetical protein BDR22DRAFT_877532 [Usnea florida]
MLWMIWLQHGETTTLKRHWFHLPLFFCQDLYPTLGTQILHKSAQLSPPHPFPSQPIDIQMAPLTTTSSAPLKLISSSILSLSPSPNPNASLPPGGPIPSLLPTLLLTRAKIQIPPPRPTTTVKRKLTMREKYQGRKKKEEKNSHSFSSSSSSGINRGGERAGLGATSIGIGDVNGAGVGFGEPVYRSNSGIANGGVLIGVGVGNKRLRRRLLGMKTAALRGNPGASKNVNGKRGRELGITATGTGGGGGGRVNGDQVVPGRGTNTAEEEDDNEEGR